MNERQRTAGIAQGIAELATVNGKDFEGMEFRKVWNPISK